MDSRVVLMGVENLALTGIRSPDRSARSESLYRLSYCGPHFLPIQHGLISVLYRQEMLNKFLYLLCSSQHYSYVLDLLLQRRCEIRTLSISAFHFILVYSEKILNTI